MKHITSRDNHLFKQLKKLADSSRERRKSGQALLDGVHLLTAYSEAFGKPELIIFAEGDSTDEAALQMGKFKDVHTVILPPAMFADLSPVATPTGILSLIQTPQVKLEQPPAFALLLEDIQQPGNLGSILRSAAAAGVEAVYLSDSCADAWSPKALRGGQGAHFVVPIIERANLFEVAADFQGQTLAATLEGESLYDLNLTQPTAFMIGNEGLGLSKELIDTASRCVSIPMPGRVESLNAAAATAVCLFERTRQLTYSKDRLQALSA